MSFAEFLKILPSIATQPLAILAYIVVFAGFLIWKIGSTQSRTFLKTLELTAEEQRPQVARDAGYSYSELSGLSPEQRYKLVVYRYVLIGFIATIIGIVLVALAAYIEISAAGKKHEAPPLDVQRTNRPTAEVPAPQPPPAPTNGSVPGNSVPTNPPPGLAGSANTRPQGEAASDPTLSTDESQAAEKGDHIWIVPEKWKRVDGRPPSAQGTSVLVVDGGPPGAQEISILVAGKDNKEPDEIKNAPQDWVLSSYTIYDTNTAHSAASSNFTSLHDFYVTGLWNVTVQAGDKWTNYSTNLPVTSLIKGGVLSGKVFSLKSRTTYTVLLTPSPSETYFPGKAPLPVLPPLDLSQPHAIVDFVNGCRNQSWVNGPLPHPPLNLRMGGP